jgi:hypothetical protein
VATDTPAPAAYDFTFTVVDGVPVTSGGTVTFQVCLASGPAVPVDVRFTSSSSARATAAPASATFAVAGECTTATLTDLETSGVGSGQVRLRANVGGTLVDQSESISFPGTP